MLVLWASTVYLLKNKSHYLMTLIPAVFMYYVSVILFVLFMINKEKLVKNVKVEESA